MASYSPGNAVSDTSLTFVPSLPISFFLKPSSVKGSSDDCCCEAASVWTAGVGAADCARAAPQAREPLKKRAAEIFLSVVMCSPINFPNLYPNKLKAPLMEPL